MGGSARERDPNVIIPETGAGKYWYVDPRAGAPQQPAQMPQQSSIERPSIDIMKAVQRLINPNPQQQVQASQALSRMSEKPYDPMEHVRLGRQQEAERMSAEHQMGPKDVYKTITIDIGKKQWEVPAVFDNMTDAQRNIIQYLPHTQWPQDIMQKIEDNARDNLEQGNDPFGNPLKPQRMGF